MKRRVLSFLLTCIMVIGMLPAAVFADETGNTGTSETPAYETPEGYIAIEIPVVKLVNAYAAATFEFVIAKEAKDDLTTAPEEIDMTVLDKTIEISGESTTYNDKLVIAVPEEEVRNFAADYTVTITEVNAEERGWTYSENVATVTFVNGNDGIEIVSIYNDAYPDTNDNGDYEPHYYNTICKAVFYNHYDLTKFNIPFTKVVEVVGEGTAPAETFTFEAYCLTLIARENDGETLVGTMMSEPIDTTTVATNGAESYDGTFALDFTSDEMNEIAGLVIVEAKGSADRWDYAENAYVIVFDRQIRPMSLKPTEVSGYDLTYYEAVIGEYLPETKGYEVSIGDAVVAEDDLTFTNTYTVPAEEKVPEVIRDIRVLLRNVFNVKASASEGGSISKPGISKVFFKHAIKYTITPAEGYEIEAVYVDGKNVGAVESYIFRDVTKDHTINAVFAAVEG